MILINKLAIKFAVNGIFYDKTKQAHFKLLKKVVKDGIPSDDWEAEKVLNTMIDQNKK